MNKVASEHGLIAQIGAAKVLPWQWTGFLYIRRDLWVAGAVVLTVALCVPFFAWVLATCRVFPFSDDWHYLAPMTQSPSIQWLFAEHNDHRIPTQKLLHLIVLTATHFDFRSLVAVNMLVAAVASLLFIGAARVYRGFGSVGDLFIPLVLLNLGTGFSQWGFEFAFLSSVLFSAAFLFFAAKRWLTLAFAALFLCAWCGLNGVLISTAISFSALLFIWWQRVTLDRLPISVLVATAATNFVLWITWVPSGASMGRPSLSQFASFVAGMLNSSLVVYAVKDHPEWTMVILPALIVAGTIAALYIAIRERSFPAFLMLAAVGSGWLLLIATAYGRAYTNPWYPGLEGHYGILAIILPVVAWIALSSAIDRRASSIVGVALVALFAVAYWSSYQWRSWVAVNDPTTLEAGLAIAGYDDPHKVAARYISRFYYIDMPEVRDTVADGIVILRGVSHYGPR